VLDLVLGSVLDWVLAVVSAVSVLALALALSSVYRKSNGFCKQQRLFLFGITLDLSMVVMEKYLQAII
jgi:hypothetical protein